MYGAKNFYCEECNWEDGEGGECPRCGSAMEDISGKEYMQSSGDGEFEEADMSLKDDFDFSDLPVEDEFEEGLN